MAVPNALQPGNLGGQLTRHMVIDWLISNWVRDLTMHLGLNWWALCGLYRFTGAPLLC
jgi:hypothetical protein